MRERTELTSWKYSRHSGFLGEKDENNMTVKCKLCPEEKCLLDCCLCSGRCQTDSTMKMCVRREAAMSPTVGRKDGYKMAAESTHSEVHVQRVSLHRQQALVGG